MTCIKTTDAHGNVLGFDCYVAPTAPASTPDDVLDATFGTDTIVVLVSDHRVITEAEQNARKMALATEHAAADRVTAARLAVLREADLIDWDRLPQSPAYRAYWRRTLDTLVKALEDHSLAARTVSNKFDPEAHPLAFGHYHGVAVAAWRERARWADLRARVVLAGR